MGRRLRSRFLLTILAFVSLVLMVEAAYAMSFGPDERQTDGARARCQVQVGTQSWPNDVTAITCTLWDTQRDGDAVYVVWQMDGYAARSLYNRDGCCGSKEVRDSQHNRQGSIGEVKWRVCRDRQQPTFDSCSDWVRYDVPEPRFPSASVVATTIPR